MESLLEKLGAIQKFINALTWKKIAQVAAFLLIIALALAAYETRSLLYNFATQSKLTNQAPPQLKLSKATTEEIITVVKKSDLIVAVRVVTVDFQKNIRSIVYTYTDDINLNDIYNGFESQGMGEFPIFNNDVRNNKRMIDLINGEFICTPFEDTLGHKIIPQAQKYVKVVCSNGIPPYYGKFTGIVSVYVSRPPTSEEVDQIRTITKKISAMIYDRDFNK